MDEQPSPEEVFPSSHCSEVVITPSPHCSLHVSTEEEEPPEQCHPGTSPVQLALHPDVPSVSPSSQLSPKTLRPSPQSGVQLVEFPLLIQVNPVSNCQLDDQPSPEEVLPSSHCSEIVIIPSPHCSLQESAVEAEPPKQYQPGIIPNQSFVQPWLSVLSPSSHASPATLRPSPHT